jgi:hypothetical protein
LGHFSHNNFSIFFVCINLNVTARVGRNTRGLQPDLHKFDTIHKEMKENAFFLTSARVPTSSAERVIWNMVKIREK